VEISSYHQENWKLLNLPFFAFLACVVLLQHWSLSEYQNHFQNKLCKITKIFGQVVYPESWGVT
jgi:hypothetical protein